jgi:SAM-dependent methyltransferase
LHLPPEIVAHYQQGGEADRLLTGVGQLELARTQEIVLRHLQGAPAAVYDVGGGPGLYACWLAGLGYQVHLLDATPLHVEQARAASGLQPDHPIASFEVGDARRLGWDDRTADAVLLLGPLYHLTDRADRVGALREAHRVLKPGGVLFAAAISRFASTLDGLLMGALQDPDFAEIARQDRIDGQHRNPYLDQPYFTTAFFHHPDELATEIEDAGFDGCQLLAVEGPVCMLGDFEQRWQDPARREAMLMASRALESEPTVIGVTFHLLGVARA